MKLITMQYVRLFMYDHFRSNKIRRRNTQSVLYSISLGSNNGLLHWEEALGIERALVLLGLGSVSVSRRYSSNISRVRHPWVGVD
jgi:hypothetical protein